MTKILRGEIWYADLNPTIAREQAKKRPCLIISTDIFNEGASDLVIILPLTSKYKNHPFHVPVFPPEGGLKKESYLLCDQIRTISRKRISGTCIGIVYQETLEEVERILKVLMDFR